MGIESLRINIDAACKGNPGLSGAGIVVGYYIGDIKISTVTFCRSLGTMTNNIAEYHALLIALEYCIDNGYTNLPIEIISDSKLVVNQMNGIFKVNNKNIRQVYNYAKRLCNYLDRLTLTHKTRNFNIEADLLANEGVNCSYSYVPKIIM